MTKSRRIAAGLAVTSALACTTAPAMAAQDARQATFGNLISALNNVAVQVDRVDALNDLTVQDVRVVDIARTLNGNNVSALNNALQNADIDAVQGVLNDNEVIKDALNANDVAVTDVVAVNVLSGGDVVVFSR